jgi:hypothetical protein
MLQLDHAEAQSANDEDGTENFRQVGERVEIGHVVPRIHSLAPPGGLEPPARGLGKWRGAAKPLEAKGERRNSIALRDVICDGVGWLNPTPARRCEWKA